MGTDRKSASQPSFKQTDCGDDDTGHDRRRRDQLEVLGRVDAARGAAAPRRRAARSSSRRRPRRIGLEPKMTKTSVAVMKAIIAMKAGTPASCEVASCSGIAIASNVMPASDLAGEVRAREPAERLASAFGEADVARSACVDQRSFVDDCPSTYPTTALPRVLAGGDDRKPSARRPLSMPGVLRDGARPTAATSSSDPCCHRPG